MKTAIAALTTMLLFLSCGESRDESGPKQSGVLHTPEMIETAKKNCETYAWAAAIKDDIVERAEPWLAYSDDELWNLMFGPAISRSWMVWSDGYCPACKNDVRMYSWKMDALNTPWKVKCPHCGELFPKNDFHAYYRSGLDIHGVFDPALADRSLLYNTEHPDKDDPLHMFGVDDGEGYVEGEKRWRFIGAYLIYGQWKQAIVGGIRNCAEAYVVTGDPRYAHVAGILLDRVADLYDGFDFGEQGIVYERKGDAGYISTWHDACEEHREMVIAYDQVFEGLKGDTELVDFISRKAREYNLSNPKTSFRHIQDNIENGILRNAIANSDRIRTNYPRREVALALTHAVLDGKENRDAVITIIDEMIGEATKVDGLSGEKGLAAYSAGPINTLASFLEMFNRRDPDFLRDTLKRHPNLAKTWRFHLDMWVNNEYFPLVGDTGSFAGKYESFPTARATKDPGLRPSMFSFLWNLYTALDDPDYVRLLYHQNGGSVEDLPYDLFAVAPEEFQNNVRDVIDTRGAAISPGSTNKEEWCIAMLRSGSGDNTRAVWIDYDSGGRHSHADGMNIGLFAKGLDLLPEFGYPPVQYGGWGAPRAVWVTKTAAHNTVMVDNSDQDDPSGNTIQGATKLWADGDMFRAITVSAPDVYDIDRYERTVAMIDISDEDFYLLDIFRVVGGQDHTKFMHSHFGSITPRGLSLEYAGEFSEGILMRNVRHDPAPSPGWAVDWQIDDRRGYLEEGRNIHLRYTDLTADAEALTAEGWISVSTYNENEELWIPRIAVRRTSDTAPLSSAFVGIIEPYEDSPSISSIDRIPLESATPDGASEDIALVMTLPDGASDIIIAAGNDKETANHTIRVHHGADIRFDGDLCLIRRDASGAVTRATLCGGTMLQIGGLEIAAVGRDSYAEIEFSGGTPRIVAGKADVRNR